MQKAYKDYLESMGVTPPDTLTGEEEDLADFFVNDAFDRTSLSYKDPITDEVKSIQNYGEFIAENFGAPGVMMSGNVGGLEKFVKEDGTFGYRNVGGGEGSNILLPQGIMAQAPSITEPETETEETFTPDFLFMNEGGLASLDREAFFVGGLAKGLKKITRSIKKIAKSPIGKAALAAAAIKFGGPLAAKAFPSTFGTTASSPFMRALGRGQFFTSKTGMPGIFRTAGEGLGILGRKVGSGKNVDFVRKGIFSNLGMGEAAIVGSTIASYFMTPEEEEEQKQLMAEADLSADPDFIMKNPELFLTYRTMAEGGSTEDKEPVAKKTMPLLDMDGMEKDYRAEGGFVPIGRMEKADDVPARLSKNEFVFTADAVRNAGDGDVDKGAEVMYNMMKNLESGGDVSEESQGLKGARKMFQTSQRLEEVL